MPGSSYSGASRASSRSAASSASIFTAGGREKIKNGDITYGKRKLKSFGRREKHRVPPDGFFNKAFFYANQATSSEKTGLRGVKHNMSKLGRNFIGERKASPWEQACSVASTVGTSLYNTSLWAGRTFVWAAAGLRDGLTQIIWGEQPGSTQRSGRRSGSRTRRGSWDEDEDSRSSRDSRRRPRQEVYDDEELDTDHDSDEYDDHATMNPISHKQSHREASSDQSQQVGPNLWVMSDNGNGIAKYYEVASNGKTSWVTHPNVNRFYPGSSKKHVKISDSRSSRPAPSRQSHRSQVYQPRRR